MKTKHKSVKDSTGFWITRLARAIERDFERRLKPFGITCGAYAVLSAIYHDKKVNPAALAVHLGMDGAAITRYLDRLEELELIERRQNAGDRRSILIDLTESGRSVAQKGRNGSKATNQKFTAMLSDNEIEYFQSVVHKMLDKSGIKVIDL